MEFVDRVEELGAMNKEYKDGNASLITIYGRRRLGKTELIKQFLDGKSGSIYYLATDDNSAMQLKSLSSLIGIRLGNEDLARFGASDWESLFLRASELAGGKKLVIAIDEFPRLARADKSIPSIFQKGWELYMKGSDIMLILCGSSISMMKSEVLNRSSPLYQRSTAVENLMPLGVESAIKLSKGMEFAESVREYFIFGGVPAYYSFTEGSKSLRRVLERVFAPGSVFLDEVSVIISEEVKNTGVYIDIVGLIANGINRPSEIASKLGIPASNAIRYMRPLVDIGLIERVVPVTKMEGRRSKSGFYIVKDNYALFWARYIKRNLGTLSLQGSNDVADMVMAELAPFEGIMFERFAMDFLAFLSRTNRFNIKFTKIGKWWGIDASRKSGDNQEEIDVVAINEKTKDILFAECKWTNAKVGADLYIHLKRKAKLVQWHNDARKERFALFSKAGFTKEMKVLAKREHVLLFGLKEIEDALKA